MEITQEEVFSPFDPIIIVDGDKEAIKIANILILSWSQYLDIGFIQSRDDLIWFKRAWLLLILFLYLIYGFRLEA